MSYMLVYKNYIRYLAALVLFIGSVCYGEVLTQSKNTRPVPQDSLFDSPQGPSSAPRETDAGRWVIPFRELMQRTYDVSGQKSEWVLGTSVLGTPELEPSALGMASVSRRYPSKLSGFFTTRLSYDGSALSLNGENGLLLEEPKGIAVDTPITDVTWDRAAFTGNALRLDFRRLITDSVTLDLGLTSRSNLNSKEYSYSSVTHSAFLSIGRDSSNVPFEGRNIAINTMHIQPTLTWRFGLGKVFVKMNYFNLQNADNTNHMILHDSLDKSVREFQTDPYTIDISTVTYGGGVEFYPIKRLTVSADFMYGNHEIEEDSLPQYFYYGKEYTDSLGRTKVDSVFYDSTKKIKYETIYGNGAISYGTLFNPTLRISYEFLNGSSKGSEIETTTYMQDREVGYLELSDTLGFFLFRTQTGIQRNSSLLDSVDYAKAYSVDVLMLLPFHLQLNGSHRHDNKFPDMAQLKFVETGRLAFPNEDLKYEERDRSALNLSWQMRDVFYGIGLRYERGKNLIKPTWVKEAEVYSDETIEEAYQWTNIHHVSSLDWLFQVGFKLGNWKFYFERGQTLDRSRKLIDTPELYYKGSIHWQNRFVKNRLGVSVRVDWQWFGNRYDCTINEDGLLELEYMKKYLALDFEARMQILSFELYSRIENFNHSVYMPESGYTPEGIRFAYGIVWTFRN